MEILNETRLIIRKLISLFIKDNLFFQQELLAALDGYSWLISSRLINAHKILSSDQSKIFHSLKYFLNHIFSVETNSKNYKIRVNIFEQNSFNEIKCTIIIRFLDFIKAILCEGVNASNLLVQNEIFCSQLYELLTLCILNPSKVGFNLKDIEVTKNLPDRLTEVLKTFSKKMPPEILSDFVTHLSNKLEEEGLSINSLLPEEITSSTHIPIESKRALEGIEIIYKSGFFNHLSQVLLQVYS